MDFYKGERKPMERLEVSTSNPMCEVELVANDETIKHHMSLEIVANFLVSKLRSADSAILCRHTVLDGGQYETNLRGSIFRVRVYDGESS